MSKRSKTTSNSELPSKSIKVETSKLLEHFEKSRNECCSRGILEFPFIKKRARIISTETNVKKGSKGILYWMNRDQRVQDNWAFLFAQKLALKNRVPLHVCFCLLPKLADATFRHFKFLIDGLKDVEEECKSLNINFLLLLGSPEEKIPQYVKDEHIGGVICDLSPLRLQKEWVENLKSSLQKDVTFVQVDAHNIVPIWEASEKKEYSARTIRNKINSKLSEYLTDFPPVIKHPHEYKGEINKIDWNQALDSLECDRSVTEVAWAHPGYQNGCKVLYEFCDARLKLFADQRNDPNEMVVSNLSPWFNFGQLSCQRAVLYVKTFSKKYSKSVESFCEEAIVRRELADNFCFYEENYNNISGLHEWARKTLNDHRKDKRSPFYTENELEEAKTYDDLWNSAQIQLVNEGKMHGFLRMYWAKKILEWAESPEEALRIAIHLNDKFSLDGNDPNGYVGCMWSIGGIHDQGWAERSIFGKIRFMNYQGCKRKFDVPAFVRRYGGKVYNK
ncbi:phr family protein [Megaselia abdita]